MIQKAVLVCGHGSRKQEGVKGLIDFSKSMQKQMPEYEVVCCFLDLSAPDFDTAIQTLYDKGIRQIIVAPAFLFGGIHVNFELPSKINEANTRFTDLNIVLAGYIGINQPLLNLCSKHINEVATDGAVFQREQECLLTVGAGASINEVNGDVAKLTRMVWENCGFGFAQYAFVSRVTFPSVSDMLDQLGKMDFKHITILPLLFFPGVYVDKIYLAAEAFSLKYQIPVSIAEPLGNDPLLIEAMLLRIKEVECLHKLY